MANYEAGYDPKYGYNRNAFAHRPPQVRLIGGIVKGITTPIGLAKEAIASRGGKDKTAAGSAPIKTTSPAEPQYDNANSEDTIERSRSSGEDEAEWALDEVATSNQPTEEEIIDPSIAELDAQTLVARIQDQPPAYTATTQKLAYPVVLPQRRPGTKSRGFVRAYAPALESSGINQRMFLEFLKSFHTASQASPIFDVIMVGAGIAGFYPNGIAQVVSIAVQAAAGTAKEMQERWRTNKFLDQANREVFMPRGLYAVVVCYKPTNGVNDVPESRTVDVGAIAMAKYGGSLGVMEQGGAEGKQSMTDEMKGKMQRLRVSSAKTDGEKEMPVNCAPLIFPALEAATDQGADANKVRSLVGNTKGASKFVQQYFDRRAQAVFNADNKDSTLAGMQPAPQFATKMSDPLDARNTHLITLITGGKIKAEPLGAKRRWEKAQKQAAERRAQGLKEKSVRRGLKEDVLYLMVVNLPTHAELEVARKELKEAKERKERRA